MKARFLAAAAAAVTLALAATAAAGPPPTAVVVEDNRFLPAAANQILESSTHWGWADTVARKHNVREDRKLFYSGPPTSDVTTSLSRTVSVGTFHYYCENHGSKSGGMDGTVKVRPLQLPPLTDDQFKVRWSDGTFDTGDRFDLRWKRATGGSYEPWIKDTTLPEAVFGEADDPIDVLPGRTYLVQGRSEMAANPKRHSGWSPALKVTASE
jgi:plastocyanin